MNAFLLDIGVSGVLEGLELLIVLASKGEEVGVGLVMVGGAGVGVWLSSVVSSSSSSSPSSLPKVI